MMAPSPENANVRIASNAEVDPRTSIGAGSVVWGLTNIREHAVLGWVS